MQGRVLIVERDPELCRQLQTRLAQHGHSVVCQRVATTQLELRFNEHVFDVLVARVDAGEAEKPLAVTGAQTGLEAVFLPPFDIELLATAVGSSLNRADAKQASSHDERDDREGLLGRSPAIKAARTLLTQLADSDTTVLIAGETGTGKEVAAHLLHARGRRSCGPFVAINCASLPESLLESELFGHARGAFTDAREKRSGLLVHAHGGTLFLDEVGELPLSLQPRLLRALQERVVRPVGSNAEVPFDVRLVTATHRDLRAEVAAGRFREDLYYRLDVVQLELPPLRLRDNDVSYLAHHFLRRFARVAGKRVAGFSAEALNLLQAYPWPGNVRELQNCIERAVALCSTQYVMRSDLPPRMFAEPTPAAASTLPVQPGELLPLAEVERRYILRVLEAVGGNKAAAAQVLGVDRRTLYRKLMRSASAARAAPRPRPVKLVATDARRP